MKGKRDKLAEAERRADRAEEKLEEALAYIRGLQAELERFSGRKEEMRA